jgi:hypothetical protein
VYPVTEAMSAGTLFLMSDTSLLSMEMLTFCELYIVPASHNFLILPFTENSRIVFSPSVGNGTQMFLLFPSLLMARTHSIWAMELVLGVELVVSDEERLIEHAPSVILGGGSTLGTDPLFAVLVVLDETPLEEDALSDFLGGICYFRGPKERC